MWHKLGVLTLAYTAGIINGWFHGDSTEGLVIACVFMTVAAIFYRVKE